ncbi:MAG: hypothetical protein HOV67_28420, partial [Kribbellaceae bacterium]|nr:hypothetical protein [Kribbellaceae bacterium]
KPSTPNQPLDRALPYDVRSLDRALNEQLTYEIAEKVMTANGLGDAYEADAPETALGGHGITAGPLTSAVFRINQVSTAPTAAARGLVDGLAEAAGRPRQRLFNGMVQSLKTDRWGLGLNVVAESLHPGVLDVLEARGLLVDPTEVRREAGRAGAKVTSLRIHTISTILAADERGYAVGLETADVLARAGKGLADLGSKASELQVAVEQPAQAATRELSPNDVLGPQVSPGGKPSTAGATPAQRAGAERPDHQAER